MSQALVQRACAKLRSAIGDEAVESLNFTVHLREMLDALEGIQPMLEDAEMWPWTATITMSWLGDARQAACVIMDMVDELQDAKSPAAATMTRMLPCLAIKKNSMAINVEHMKNEVIMLKEYWHDYISVEEGKLTQQRQQVMDERATGPFLEEASVIGRGSDKQRVLDVLLSAASNITPILPIFGLAGSGKTTLAKMVFNDTNSPLQVYSFRVWVYVSLQLNFHRICESILRQVVSGGSIPDVVGMDGIMKRLRELLNGTKVLLVLDDLWEEDPIQLHLLKSMLTFLGDKVDVIVTTCNQAIARKICTVEPYRLNPLGDDACWEIIKKSVRFELVQEKKIRREIASKCLGIPSVAQAFAGMLDSRDPLTWEEVMRADMWDMDYYSLYSILALSYRSMPPDLRLCFHHCCDIFPNGDNIVKDDLIHQWIALDLIEPSEILSATHIAEEYITRLLDMSFLQTAKSDPASGNDDKGATMFTMHDLPHNYARWLVDKLGIGWYMLVTNYRGKLDDDGSFSSKRSLRVLELKESSVHKLPDSIWQLRYLRHLKITEFSGLVTLPESFGDLINLFHVDLSGCSGLITLPESFGKLIRLVHANLSGCSGLATLPESFGDLINLSHLNLSRCHGLAELPKQLQKLGKLVHLDLSFWSWFEGIGKGLGGLTNLDHLNLSHPCCHLAQQSSHLQELKDGLCRLTSLRYLNLSMCLNPIFYYKSEKDNLQYIESCLSGLSSLEHLNLSHNTFLFDLPQSLGGLNKLHTLDLSGCIRLKNVAEMKSLKFIALRNCRGLESCHFVVRVIDDDDAYSSSNIVQLEGVNCQELQISCLEKVKSKEEAHMIRLVEKQKLEKLKLCWSVGTARGSVKVEDNALLEELVPPHSLQCLELHGYGVETFKLAWRISSISSHLSNLVEVTMEDFPRCMILPPLGLLPNLERLVLRRMPSIARIDDIDLGGGGGNRGAFSRLSKVTIDDMENLKVFLFPGVAELVIQKCPELGFGPLPPRAHRLVISDCNKVMSSWGKRQGDDEEGSSNSAPVSELVVENCNLPLGDSSLLHHLPGVHSLRIKNCRNVITSSVEITWVLYSLQSLCFSHCENMISLPEYFGDLTSLKELSIESCHGMESLLQSLHKLTNLKDLYILDCPELKRWCESGENKAKLAHIRPKYEKLDTGRTV